MRHLDGTGTGQDWIWDGWFFLLTRLLHTCISSVWDSWTGLCILLLSATMLCLHTPHHTPFPTPYIYHAFPSVFFVPATHILYFTHTHTFLSIFLFLISRAPLYSCTHYLFFFISSPYYTHTHLVMDSSWYSWACWFSSAVGQTSGLGDIGDKGVGAAAWKEHAWCSHHTTHTARHGS